MGTQYPKEEIVKVSEMFPSKYLSASDIGKKKVRLTISGYRSHQFKPEDKPKLILSFNGTSREMVCNATNTNTLVGLYSDEMDNWIGQPIILTTAPVTYAGKLTTGIMVLPEVPAPAGKNTVGKQPEPPPVEDESDLPPEAFQDDDDIPF